MNKIQYTIIFLARVALAVQCSGDKLCCDSDYNTCQNCASSSCTLGSTATCAFTADATCPPTECGSSGAGTQITAAPLAAGTTYYYSTGAGYVDLPIDPSTHFSNPEPDLCRFRFCGLYGALTSSTCDSTLSTLRYSWSGGSISIDTTQTGINILQCFGCQVVGSAISGKLVQSGPFTIATSNCVAGSSIDIVPAGSATPATSLFPTIALNTEIEWTLPLLVDQSSANCQVESYQLVDSTNNPYSDLTLTVTGSNLVVSVPAAFKHRPTTYNFKIQYTIQAPQGEVGYYEGAGWNTAFTLNPQCGPSNAPSFINPIAYSSTQYAPTTSAEFDLPFIQTDLLGADASSCGISTLAVFQNDESTLHSGLNTPTLVSGSGNSAIYKVTPVASTPAEYDFKVKATGEGGTHVFSPAYKLIVGCSQATLYATHNHVTFSYTELVDPSTNYAFGIYTPPSSGNPNCAISAHSIINQMNAADSSPNSVVTLDASNNLKLSTLAAPLTVQFEVQTDFGTGVTVASSTITVQVQCSTADKSISPPPGFTTTKTYYTHDTVNSIFTWPAFSCQTPACCGTISYFLGDSSKAAVAGITQSGLQALLPYTNPAILNLVFWYWDDRNNNNFQTSISVNINDICATDTFSLTSSLADGSNVTVPAGSAAWVQLDVATSSFKQLRVDMLKTSAPFDINLAQFISHTQSVHCPITAFTLPEVQDSSGPLSVSKRANGFELNPATGVMTLNPFPAEYSEDETYQIILQATNGLATSLFSTSSPLEAVAVVRYFEPPTHQADPIPATAPYFVTPLSSNYTVISRSASADQEIALPEVFDPNMNQSVTVSIQDLNTTRFTLNNATRTLIVHSSAFMKTETTNLTIVLTDSTGLKTESACSITVFVDSSISNEIGSSASGSAGKGIEVTEEEGGASNAETKPKLFVKFRVESFSPFGKLRLSFNESSFARTKAASLSSEAIDIYVVPAENRDKEGSFMVNTVNFTWVAEAIIQDTLSIQLSFFEPVEISPLLEQDRLVVHFKRPIITTEDHIFEVAEPTLTFRAKKQLSETPFTKQFQVGATTAEASLKWLLVMSFALQLLLSGGMQYMIGFIRSLQLILHLPLAAVAVPANAMLLFSRIISIAMFDVLDPSWTTELVLQFDEEAQDEFAEELAGQWQDLGYENCNSIQNLGSLAVFTSFYLFKLICWAFANLVSKATGRGGRLASYLKQGLFFGDILALLLDAYFEFLISGYLLASHPLFSTNGEVYSFYLGYASLALAVFFLPGALLYVGCSRLDKTQDEDFQERWGSLYGDLRNDSKLYQLYYLWFVFRRAIFISIVVFWGNFPNLQVQSLLLLNLFSAVYIGTALAHQERLLSKIEIINEIVIQGSTLFLNFFIALEMRDEQAKSSYGWLLCGVVVAFSVFNLIFILKKAIWQIGLVIKRIIKQTKKSTQQLTAQKASKAALGQERTKASESKDSQNDLDSDDEATRLYLEEEKSSKSHERVGKAISNDIELSSSPRLLKPKPNDLNEKGRKKFGGHHLEDFNPSEDSEHSPSSIINIAQGEEKQETKEDGSQRLNRSPVSKRRAEQPVRPKTDAKGSKPGTGITPGFFKERGQAPAFIFDFENNELVSPDLPEAKKLKKRGRKRKAKKAGVRRGPSPEYQSLNSLYLEKANADLDQRSNPLTELKRKYMSKID